MLISPEGKRTNHLPHQEEFRSRRANLSDADYQAVVAEINDYADGHDKVQCAFFASGDWGGTPREALVRACHEDMEEAAKFLGQILWLVLQDRPEQWWFYRPRGLNDEVVGMVYARR